MRGRPRANLTKFLKETRTVLCLSKWKKYQERDRERLVKVCCAPQLPISIQGAPRPAGLVGTQA